MMTKTKRPTTDDVPAVHDGHPLANLLFNGATREEVAEYLRTVRDEWNANQLSEWLCLVRDALPAFRRAEADGCDVVMQRLEHEQRMQLKSFAANPAIETERKRLNELDARKIHAECALLAVRRYAPALLDDPRSQQVGDSVDSATITAWRLRIENYFVERKLDISVHHDKWPLSQHRSSTSSAGRVKLVTVEQSKPGLRVYR